MPILVAGATGNTGRSVVSHLSSVSIPVIALTRDAASPAAQKLAALPGVTVEAQDWREVTAEWLRARDITRVFIASHNGPSHFMDESLFLTQARRAGVRYLVRISTTAPFVIPASTQWYARAHWAIENLLEQPEFSGSGSGGGDGSNGEGMQWTSLQPNVFSSMISPALVAWLESYRKTGKKEVLRLLLSEHGRVAQIDADDVGRIAGHLLALDDASVAAHSGKRYVLAGPTDISGKETKELLEKVAGTTIGEVEYNQTAFVYSMMRESGVTQSAVEMYDESLRMIADGATSLEKNPTSKAVLELCAPRSSAQDVFEQALKAVQ